MQTVSIREYKKLAFKRNKYGNIKCQGKDSIKEYKRGLYLKEMEKEGKISDLQEQVTFLLQDRILSDKGKVLERAIKFVADYVYNEGGDKIIEDVKSWITKRNSTYIMKRKMVKKLYPEYKFKES